MNSKTDARNRALRTFFQGLGIDVLAALVLLTYPILSGAQSWTDFDWAVIGFLAAKTVATTILSYVMRYFSIGKKTLSNDAAATGAEVKMPVASR